MQTNKQNHYSQVYNFQSTENQRKRKKQNKTEARLEGETLTYKRIEIRITSNFSSEITQTRREWGEIFKALSEKNHQCRILYPEKLSFKVKEK